MVSFKILQNLAQTAGLATRDNALGVDAVHARIYDLAVNAFMSEVLTLGRMTRVVQAVHDGIADSNIPSHDKDVAGEARSQREAYRGLCAAATEGLAAAGLAHAQFCKFSGNHLSVELGNTLSQEILAYKQLLDHITTKTDWHSHSRINLLQEHWFGQLLQPVGKQGAKQANGSAIPWSDVFFQSCGYETKAENSGIQANLMLLGLITSGAFAAIRASQAAA